MTMKKIRCCWFREGNRPIYKSMISRQDTDRNHVILTNLIGGFRFSHQNGTGGIILGGHHVDGAYNQIPIRVADHITGGEKKHVFHLKYRIGRMCHMRFNGGKTKKETNTSFFNPLVCPRFRASNSQKNHRNFPRTCSDSENVIFNQHMNHHFTSSKNRDEDPYRYNPSFCHTGILGKISDISLKNLLGNPAPFLHSGHLKPTTLVAPSVVRPGNSAKPPSAECCGN